MQKLHDRLNAARRSERGDSELVSMILMLPIVVYIFLTLVNWGIYQNVRSQIQQQALDGARLVALYGGTGANLPTNTSGKSVQQTITNNVAPGGKCAFSRCGGSLSSPSVSCYVQSANGQQSPTAKSAGEKAVCTIRYQYYPVTGNDIFGFTSITNVPFTVEGDYYTETGFGG